MRAVVTMLAVVLFATVAGAAKKSSKSSKRRASETSRIECAAYTRTGTKSWMRFYVDPNTGVAQAAQFTFALRGGHTNVLTFDRNDSNIETDVRVTEAPGSAGEISIHGSFSTSDTFNSVSLNYEGNDFATRLSSKYRRNEVASSTALMNLFLRLADRGNFGHVSKDPKVDPRSLGGTIQGQVIWNNFSEPISFKNIICAKFY